MTVPSRDRVRYVESVRVFWVVALWAMLSAPSAWAQCTSAGNTCERTDDCCRGFCVESSLGTLCHDPCTRNSECMSNCCAELQTGGKVCFAASACEQQCTAVGGTCQASTDCCDGVCVRQGDSGVCRSSCEDSSGCTSGCCLMLTGGGGACFEASRCRSDDPPPDNSGSGNGGNPPGTGEPVVRNCRCTNAGDPAASSAMALLAVVLVARSRRREEETSRAPEA